MFVSIDPFEYAKCWRWQIMFTICMSAAVQAAYAVEPPSEEEVTELLELLESVEALQLDPEDEEEIVEYELEMEREIRNADRRSTKSLIRQMKKDPFPGFNPAVVVLGRRGMEVLPLLMKELENADGYYRNILFETIALIPCKNQIDLFLEELERFMEPGEKHFLEWNNAGIIIHTLGHQRAQIAVPVLTRLLEGDQNSSSPAPGVHLVPGLRAEVRLALNLIGDVRLRDDAIDRIDVARNLVESVQKEHKELFSILKALLDHEFISFDVALASVERSDAEVITLKGDIPEAGTWELACGPKQGNRIPVYYEWFTGGLSAGGYVGVLQRVDDQWLVVYWQELWIS